MKNLAIIGAGDLGQLIAYHASETKQYEVVGYFDDSHDIGKLIKGKPVLGGTPSVQNSYEAGRFEVLMIGIGYKHFFQRKAFFEKYHTRIPFATIIHPSSKIMSSCVIKEGTFILPGCILDNNVIIKENVVINTGCIIAHDSLVGEHTFLSPAVAIAGFVNIGSCCNIGINTTIIDNIKICDNVQTGGGSVIIKNIIQEGLYVGNPSRFLRKC